MAYDENGERYPNDEADFADRAPPPPQTRIRVLAEPPSAHQSRLRESPQTDKVYLALGQAQALFKPVRCNKTAKVFSKRTGQTHTYHYASLDKILKMALPFLAKAGLTLVTPPMAVGRSMVAVVKLAHGESGQWIEAELTLPRDMGERLQEFGSDLSYIRRYIITALLCIAIDGDDDDAGGKLGNEVQGRPAGAAPIPELSDSFRNSIYRQLVKGARAAESIGDLDYLMSFWLTHALTMEPTRADAAAWRLLADELHAAIGRLIHPVIGAMFVRALEMSSPASANTVEALIESKWKPELEKLRADLPETAKWLDRHFAIQLGRFAPIHAGEITVESIAAGSVTPEKIVAGTFTREEIGAATGSPHLVVGQLPKDPPKEPAPAVDDAAADAWEGGFAIYDENGEPTQATYSDPVRFAREMVSAYEAAAPEKRRALLEFNEEPIGWASENDAAAAILSQIAPEPTDEDLIVAPPRSAGGTLVVAAYISALKAKIAEIKTGRALDHFEELMERAPDYVSLGDPAKVRMRASVRLRRAELKGS